MATAKNIPSINKFDPRNIPAGIAAIAGTAAAIMNTDILGYAWAPIILLGIASGWPSATAEPPSPTTGNSGQSVASSPSPSSCTWAETATPATLVGRLPPTA